MGRSKTTGSQAKDTSSVKQSKCVYRNIQLMPGRDDLWQFEVQDKADVWYTVTNIGGDDKEARLEMVKKTAEHYGKRVIGG